MNYIRHLNAFFALVKGDKRLTSAHVSLYMALFQCWNFNRFSNPIPITRENVMSLSAIGSKNTYHKSLKDLHQFGYIFYRASLTKFHKSTVYIVKLGTSDPSGSLQQLNLFAPPPGSADTVQNIPVTSPNPVQVKNGNGIKIDTVPVPILTFASPKFDPVPVPYLGLLIKHKQINNKQEREENSLTQKIFSKNKDLQEGINVFSAAVKNGTHQNDFQQPSIDQVISFFLEKNYPAPEAKKFFNHYQSNGWLVGGKSPMQNWQSSGHKWMMNVSNFQTMQSKQNGKHQQTQVVDPGPGKDYSEPL